MPRTKEDFLSYAKASLNSRESSYPNRSNGIFEDTTTGNENSISDAWGPDQSYADSDESSTSATGTVQFSGSIFAGTDESDYEGERGSNNGVRLGDSGSDGFTQSATGYDIPIRNRYDIPIQSTSSISTNTRRTVKRVSALDNMLGKAGNFLSGGKKNKPSAPKVVSSVARKLLTIGEVQKHRAKLVTLLIRSSENLDHGISAITKHHREVEIWSNIEYVDAEILVDCFLQAAQKSQRWADAARKVIDISERWQVGIILAPRIYKTIVYLITTGIDIRMI